MSGITQKWVKLLSPFTTHYAAQLSASELAKTTHTPQQSTSRYLDTLVKLNIIEYAKKGKTKLFYLNLEKQTTKTILNLLENQKTLQFQLEHKEPATIINELMKHCETTIIFGSYANGTYDKESDLDIAIIGKCDRTAIKNIKQKQIIEINEHYATYQEFEKIVAQKNPLAIEIIKNHIIFGNISEISNMFWKHAKK